MARTKQSARKKAQDKAAKRRKELSVSKKNQNFIEFYRIFEKFF